MTKKHVLTFTAKDGKVKSVDFPERNEALEVMRVFLLNDIVIHSLKEMA